MPQLGEATSSACTLQRFTLAAAAVRARIFPPYTVKEPCIALGAELVRISLPSAMHGVLLIVIIQCQLYCCCTGLGKLSGAIINANQD